MEMRGRSRLDQLSTPFLWLCNFWLAVRLCSSACYPLTGVSMSDVHWCASWTTHVLGIPTACVGEGPAGACQARPQGSRSPEPSGGRGGDSCSPSSFETARANTLT